MTHLHTYLTKQSILLTWCPFFDKYVYILLLTTHGLFLVSNEFSHSICLFGCPRCFLKSIVLALTALHCASYYLASWTPERHIN